MALSLESPSLVRQKVYAALSAVHDSKKGRIIWQAAREFFRDWVESGGNANLQFIPFSEADADDADGTGLADTACKVYFVYTKKENSATDNWTKLYNETTVDTTTTAAWLALPQLEANVDSFYVAPAGIPFDVGVVVTQHTELIGTTDGSNGAGGFIVIGAA